MRPSRPSRVEKEQLFLNAKADIFRVTTLARVKAGAEANERSAEEVSDEIRDSMEAKLSEREKA